MAWPNLFKPRVTTPLTPKNPERANGRRQYHFIDLNQIVWKSGADTRDDAYDIHA